MNQRVKVYFWVHIWDFAREGKMTSSSLHVSLTNPVKNEILREQELLTQEGNFLLAAQKVYALPKEIKFTLIKHNIQNSCAPGLLYKDHPCAISWSNELGTVVAKCGHRIFPLTYVNL